MTQDIQYIETLVERFFEGETTHAEEQELYEFFSQENVPAALQHHRSVFQYFDNGLKEELQQTQAIKNPSRQSGKKWIITVGIAASILLAMIPLNLFRSHKQEAKPYENCYVVHEGKKITDPKIVEPEVEKMLENVIQQEIEIELMMQEAFPISEESN